MNMTAYYKARVLAAHCLEHCCAAEATALGAAIQKATGRRMAYEHTSRRAWSKEGSGLFFSEVIAPGTERSNGNPAAKAKEVHSLDLHARTMKNIGGGPIPARFYEFLEGFVIARHKDCRDRCLAEQGYCRIQAPSERGEIACANQNIGVGCAAHDAADRRGVCMDVAEAEQFHGSGQTSWRAGWAKVLQFREYCC